MIVGEHEVRGEAERWPCSIRRRAPPPSPSSAGGDRLEDPLRRGLVDDVVVEGRVGDVADACEKSADQDGHQNFILFLPLLFFLFPRCPRLV